MKKHLPPILVFILSVLGCASTETIESTKVSPAEIYQEYSISASRNRTDVTTTFRVGGALGMTVDLDAPARVEHDGTEMTESAPSFLKGTTYHYYASRFEPAHRFVYTDAGGETYRNEISLEPLEIRGDSFNLSRSGINKIPLSRATGDDEKILVSLSSEIPPPPATEPNSNANITSDNAPAHSLSDLAQLDETRTALIIQPNQLKKFVPGKAYLKLEVRKEEATKQQTEKGGKMIFSYESQGVGVNVLN